MSTRGNVSESFRWLRDIRRNAGSGSGRLWTDNNGGPMVEFAVMAPLFFIILFGIVEWGSMFYLQNNMVNAAREGARTAAVQGGTMAAASQSACRWLSGSGQTFTITSTDRCNAAQDVTVQVSISRANASLFNMFLGVDSNGGLTNSTWSGNIGANVTMRKEAVCAGTQAASACNCNTSGASPTGC
jgi:Flp pilus assembly protein TadG